jgi:cell wall-associated NlpC family hydrolase
VSSQKSGRHRAPSLLTSALNLSSTISHTAKPATKASAVIVISGAMVAALALPATAAPSTITTTIATSAPVALGVAVTAPSAAQAPLVSPTFGNIGFTGVVKPRPVVVPVAPRAVVAVSRSTTRVRIAPAPAAASTPKPSTRRPVAKRAVAAPASHSGGVLGIAASLAGIYYIYGGTTTAGFDCSGFTKYVFNKVGINLPRTAAAQQQAATRVSKPQPGDLVFFGSPAYHVGIYAGNNMMWDSPHTGKSISKRTIWSSSATYGRP